MPSLMQTQPPMPTQAATPGYKWDYGPALGSDAIGNEWRQIRDPNYVAPTNVAAVPAAGGLTAMAAPQMAAQPMAAQPMAAQAGPVGALTTTAMTQPKLPTNLLRSPNQEINQYGYIVDKRTGQVYGKASPNAVEYWNRPASPGFEYRYVPSVARPGTTEFRMVRIEDPTVPDWMKPVPVTTPAKTPTGGTAATTTPLAPVTPPPPQTKYDAQGRPIATAAGTAISGPTATVVLQSGVPTMYTSDGLIIKRPNDADYAKYNVSQDAKLKSYGASPTAVQSGLAFIGNNKSTATPQREVSQYQYDPNKGTVSGRGAGGITPGAGFGYGGIGPQVPSFTNPYGAYGRGQDISKAYVTSSGSIVLPGGYVIQNPTMADYEQYDVGSLDPLKGGIQSAEKQTINQIKIAQSSALKLAQEAAKEQGLSSADTKQLIDTISQQQKADLQTYMRRANLPGQADYKNYYTQTPEQFLAKLPEEQRVFRPSAQQVFNSLPPADKAKTNVANVQKWLDSNPNFKVELNPQMIQSAAAAGDINLGTRLIGWDYEKLGVTDPEQLKALNQAGSEYNVGINLLNEWGLLQGSKSGETSTGVGVRTAAAIAQAVADGSIAPGELKQYLPGVSDRGLKQWTNFANDMAALRGDKEITLDDLRRVTPGGTAPKLIDPENNLYAVSAVKYKKGDKYILAQKTGDDRYRIVGGTSMFTPENGGGFWSYVPAIASIGLSLVAPGLGTAIGSAITGAATAGLAEAVIGNAIIGALQSGITGGNIGMGALTGGLSGGLTQGISSGLGGLNIGGLPLNQNLVNTITGGLTNLALSPITGANAGQILAGTGLNVAGNLAGSAVRSGVESVLPAGTSPRLTNALSSGLTAAGLSAATGASTGGGLQQLGQAAGIIPGGPAGAGLAAAASNWWRTPSGASQVGR